MARAARRRYQQFALALLCSGMLAAQSREASLPQRLDQLLASEDAGPGLWGVSVYALGPPRAVYGHNAERLFVPASTLKLATTAAALTQLGADYRWHTVVRAASGPDAAGVVSGDLVLVGDGDPTLSGRPFPYRYLAHPPLPPWAPDAALEELAAQLAAAGVRQIDGDVVALPSYVEPQPYPPGWEIEDLPWGYGAPPSALAVNENSRFVVLRPGAAPGAPATLEVYPPDGDEPELRNRVDTGAAGAGTHIDLADDVDGAVDVTGTIALDSAGDLETVAVRDPAAFAARQFLRALNDHDIVVRGRPRAAALGAEAAAGAELARHDSPPLWQVLQATDKESLNFEAEMLLPALAQAAGGAPTRADGLDAVRDFLRGLGAGPAAAHLEDGSGLSRRDDISPAALVAVLRAMDTAPAAARWHALLPAAGADGTLATRLVALAGRVEAKTGSMSGVNALAGYAVTSTGRRLAFAIVSNNDPRPEATVRAFLDRLVQAIAQ